MNHLNTTSCCTHTFSQADIKPPLMSQKLALGTNDMKLYGGNAKWFAKAVCPDCGQDRMLWLMPVPRGYKVLTISAVKGEDATSDDSLAVDVETADKDQLRAYLRQKGVSFFNGASEEQLRELARGTLALL